MNSSLPSSTSKTDSSTTSTSTPSSFLVHSRQRENPLLKHIHQKILSSSNEQLSAGPGLGTLKAQRLYQAFNQPFKRQKQKININKQDKNFDEKFDLANIDEDI
ncbi:unnamed protein product [Rotaria magnacalcarata]|uniref:Uncharacterized protein n=1 Tax=Rotaria magnacalcarata TaxID=392030 RepID=A0A819MF16_9BILA|nr:unnamed protein product [Rotaria magnacalcarata]CAF3798430.1 unnamed protein product [Rotaria magnacalcarata]CAF3798839.1 unnamed protein product [Rotaria magnacalcarata]CAF3978453.1 unnamed protein product [Rotaria magnacalcarata]